MSSLRQWLYGLALLAALGLLIYAQTQRIAAADTRADLAAERQQAAEQRIGRQAVVIDSLQNELAKERRAQKELRTQQDQLRTALATRNRSIEDLTRENEALRQWAAIELPATARRLRERPALTGAGAYREWLSSGDAMRTAGDRSP